jgi:hypothetical protein
MAASGVSTVWKIRGARGGDVTIKRRRRDAEAVRDLRHADIRIGEQGSRGFKIILR